MNRMNFLIVSVVCFALNAPSQEKPKLASREEVLKEIEVFAKSPVSAEGKAAAWTIVRFAQENEDVLINISPKVLPWANTNKEYKYSETLLAAYLAGNVKSQLHGRARADDPYAGIQQVLKTYAQLREFDKTLDIPEVQKFVDLEKKNELKKYLDQAVKKTEKDPSK
jgi:hypothetical protein